MSSNRRQTEAARTTSARKSRSSLRRDIARRLAFPVFVSAALWQRLLGSSRERLSGSWTSRLKYGVFLQSLPAVATMGTVVVVAVLHFLSRDSLPAQYANWSETALQTRQFDRAVICLQRLLAFHPGDRPLQFRLAAAYAGQGEQDSALALMQSLAPRDEVGYPPAQLWLVRRRLTDSAGVSPAALRELESRLMRLQNLPEVGEEAAALLADVYFRTGRAKQVLDEPQLKAAAETSPNLRLPLTQARLAHHGSTDKSPAVLRAEVDQLVAQYRRESAARPDDVETRLRLAKSLLLLDDFDAAEVVLREGLTLADDVRLREALVQTACGRVDQAVLLNAPPAKLQAPANSARQIVARYAAEGAQKQLAIAKLTALAGNIDEAATLYLKLVDTAPLVRLDLAEMLRRYGRTQEAETHYLKLLDGVDPKRPPDDATLRLAYGTANRRLERFAAARDWFAPLSDALPAAEQMLIETLLTWSDRLPESESKLRLELLVETLRRSPQQLEAWKQILNLSAGDGPSAADAQRTLTDLLAQGDAGSEVYALLGTHALQQRDEAAALRYLEQAERLNPQSGAVMNNLAWLLAFGKQPDLQRALVLANAAVLRYPHDPRLRDTRGRIFAKLRRWSDALSDLEQCRQAYDADPTYHQTLAEVYEQLGLAEPAEAHRRRERELKAAAPPSTPAEPKSPAAKPS